MLYDNRKEEKMANNNPTILVPPNEFKLTPESSSKKKELDNIESETYVMGNPEDPEDKEGLYKVLTYKDGTTKVERIIVQNQQDLENKNTIDKSVDNANDTPMILRSGFSLKARIRGVNGATVDSFKNSPLYKKLDDKIKLDIEHDKNIKQMYRCIALDDVKGVHNLIDSGKVRPEALNAFDGLAVKMVVSTGNLEMAQTLFQHGASAHGIDPRNCYTKEMANLVIDEQYKKNNPIVSTLRESLGMGTAPSRYKMN